jgi:hypothetical protein
MSWPVSDEVLACRSKAATPGRGGRLAVGWRGAVEADVRSAAADAGGAAAVASLELAAASKRDAKDSGSKSRTWAETLALSGAENWALLHNPSSKMH